MSLSSVAVDLADKLSAPVLFLDDCIGAEVGQAIDNLENGQVALLENLVSIRAKRRTILHSPVNSHLMRIFSSMTHSAPLIAPTPRLSEWPSFCRKKFRVT